MKINYRKPKALLLMRHLCFLPWTLVFHLDSFLGLFNIFSGQTGLTKPCSSGPGDLEKVMMRYEITKQVNQSIAIRLEKVLMHNEIMKQVNQFTLTFEAYKFLHK